MHVNLHRFERASPSVGVSDVVIPIKTVQQDAGIAVGPNDY